MLLSRDTTGSKAFLAALEPLLTATLGPQGTIPHFTWMNGPRWNGPGITVMAGIGNRILPPDTSGYQPALEIVAASTQSEMGSMEMSIDLDDPELTHPFPFDELLAIAAVDRNLGLELRTALDAIQRHDTSKDWRATPAETERFIDALERWRRVTAPLPPPQRAAALLIADEMAEGSPQTGWGADSGFEVMTARFNALGIPIVHYAGGDGNSYTRRFMKDAIDLDTGTRAGDIAFILAARAGFDFSVCSENGAEDFRVVIKRGNDYLSRHPNSTITGELHFLIARAWGDIVNVGAGGGVEVDPVELDSAKAESPIARQHAIAEYRAALETLPAGPERKNAWIEGWRLLAGLAPVITRFRCTND